MGKFNFHLDSKVTTWYRTQFEIEADTLEEARVMAVELIEDGKIDELPWEQIEGVVEGMTPDENGGMSTEELYDEENNIIHYNGKI